MNRRRLFSFALFGVVILILAACRPEAAPTPKPPPTPVDAVGVVTSFYDALNAKRVDVAMTSVSEDAIFTGVFGYLKGRESIRSFLQINAELSFTYEVSDLTETNGRVTYTYRFSGNPNNPRTYGGSDGLAVVENGKITYNGDVASAP